MTRTICHIVATLALAFGTFSGSACTELAPIEGAACNLEHTCPGGFGCAGGACRRLKGGPIKRCADDSACAIGRCLVETGFCVQCLENSDCVASACLPDVYQCGCRANADCATGRCNIATATCLSCRADEQCDSGDCDLDTGVCRKIDDAPVGTEGEAP